MSGGLSKRDWEGIGLSESDWERIAAFARTPKYKRNPEMLVPEEGDRTEG